MTEDNIINAIVITDPLQAVARAKSHSRIVHIMRRDNVLRAGVDFGVIPGTNKPTLLKPGAEKLCSAFGLRPVYKAITLIEDFDKPLFHYRYECSLYHIETDKLIATAIGSCNSMESKYGFRWVSVHEVPQCLAIEECALKSTSITEFDFAVNKAETGGQWGKPQSYWDTWQNAIKSGEAVKIKRKTKSGKEMDAWQLVTNLYRVTNPDIYSQINTIDKMAQKRSLIAVTLVATNASEDFTQDIEDMPGFGTMDTADVIDAEFEDINPQSSTLKPDFKPEPKSPSWNKQRRDGLYAYWQTNHEFTKHDVLTFLGITDETDTNAWDKYPTNESAQIAIQAAWNAELAKTPPAKPKNAPPPAAAPTQAEIPDMPPSEDDVPF